MGICHVESSVVRRHISSNSAAFGQNDAAAAAWRIIFMGLEVRLLHTFCLKPRKFAYLSDFYAK